MKIIYRDNFNRYRKKRTIDAILILFLGIFLFSMPFMIRNLYSWRIVLFFLGCLCVVTMIFVCIQLSNITFSEISEKNLLYPSKRNGDRCNKNKIPLSYIIEVIDKRDQMVIKLKNNDIVKINNRYFDNYDRFKWTFRLILMKKGIPVIDKDAHPTEDNPRNDDAEE